MMTRSGIHAIRAMVILASMKPGEYCGTSVIAESTDAPRNYLGKLLLTLSRRGLVDSQKGLGGGFRLSRSPDEISLLDIIESIEDVARWKECAFGGKVCSDATPCVVHHRWTHVREAYMSFLRGTSVAELVASRALNDAVTRFDEPSKTTIPSKASRRPQ